MDRKIWKSCQIDMDDVVALVYLVLSGTGYIIATQQVDNGPKPVLIKARVV